LAIVLSTFFGLGVVLLALIQREANTNQAGLDKFIFGQAAAFLKKDIYFLIGIIILVLFVILLFWKNKDYNERIRNSPDSFPTNRLFIGKHIRRA